MSTTMLEKLYKLFIGHTHQWGSFENTRIAARKDSYGRAITVSARYAARYENLAKEKAAQRSGQEVTEKNSNVKPLHIK